jgi:hypothetical protein
VSRRIAQIVGGLLIVAVGAYLAMSPLVVAELLGRPPTTSSSMINLRASWGGTMIGIGAFSAWVPALRPWLRSGLGLVMWAMAGIGLARAIGFVIDGDPDGRQYVWLIAEVAIVVGCAFGLHKLGRTR